MAAIQNSQGIGAENNNIFQKGMGHQIQTQRNNYNPQMIYGGMNGASQFSVKMPTRTTTISLSLGTSRTICKSRTTGASGLAISCTLSKWEAIKASGPAIIRNYRSRKEQRAAKL